MALKLGENAVKAEIPALRDKQIVTLIAPVWEILSVESTTAALGVTSVIIISMMIAVLLRARKEETVRK